MAPAPTTPTRWRPTPDQLMILEELYMGGIKTPSAAHIQRITAHLSLYGKIECKNVFYWFQNHKAREKQKLRKRLLLGKQLQLIPLQDPLPPPPHPPPPPPPHHHQIMGQDYHHHHHNNVLYLLQPHYNCGFMHTHQGQGGGLVRCGSPQIIDNTWPRLYRKGDDDDVSITSLTTTDDHLQLSPRAAVTRPLKTLQLFPTTTTTMATAAATTTT